MLDLRKDKMSLLKTLKVGDVFLDQEGNEKTITNVLVNEYGNVFSVEYS